MKECFLCGKNGAGDPLEKHHAFGGALRKKSEKYGLYVYLCGDKCHRNGPKAAHVCRETADMIRRWAQETVMREQGWDTERFIREFGKNYL